MKTNMQKLKAAIEKSRAKVDKFYLSDKYQYSKDGSAADIKMEQLEENTRKLVRLAYDAIEAQKASIQEMERYLATYRFLR